MSLEDEDLKEMDPIELRHPIEHTKRRNLSQSNITQIEPLLKEVLGEGKMTYELPTLKEIRHQREEDVDRLDPGVRRIMNPHIYHVSLTQKLWDLKQNLIRSTQNK
jgi:nicotinate phosphoribosyltransferase